MGIPGLMSYLTQRSGRFSTSIELHDTHLVIDGSCVLFQLYVSNRCNYCFGGNYSEYAFYVSEFFEDLLKCKITPIVVMDGGMEDKKMVTLYNRAKQRVVNSCVSTPLNQLQMIPLLAKDVFRYIARQKNIKCVQSLFEADDNVASIARLLNCPVLSFDSDFFIYDVMYIPFKTLKHGVFKNSAGYGFVKHCKLFRSDHFQHNFPGIDKKVLPLAAAILGNDYIKSSVFKEFFLTLKISKSLKRGFASNKLHLRIEAILKWMQYQSIDHALGKIILKLKPEDRQEVIEVIEMVINGYLNLSTALVDTLGYEEREISALKNKITCDSYKFVGLDNLEIRQDIATDNDTDLSCDEEFDTNLTIEENLIIKPQCENNIDEILPTWFIKEFNACKFQGYFMDILNRQLIVVTEQIEDTSQPPCIQTSLKIVKVICKLLSNGTTNHNSIKYVARSGNDIKTYELDFSDLELQDCEIPTLQNLVNLPVINRRNILTSTLGVSDRLIVEFPPTWRLYVAVIKYWLNEAEKIFVTKWHFYSLTLLIIFHVVLNKIRNHSYFDRMNSRRNSNQFKEIKQAKFPPSLNMSVKEALEMVNKDDCLRVENFFKSHMSIDSKFGFNRTVIHAFSLFQNSLKYSMHLNALLGNPYLNVNIADFFHGTLVYNLYCYLKSYNNLNKHFLDIFKDSPSILQLFVSVTTKIEDMLKNDK